MTLKTIPPWTSPLIEQACKRSKKKAFHFLDLLFGQQYTFFYSTNTSHAWNKFKVEGGQGAHEGAALFRSLTGSRPGLPRSWVDWILPGYCLGRSFIKPEPVQPPGQPSPGSTHRAESGLITMVPIASLSYSDYLDPVQPILKRSALDFE
jgi:hypothetical protein